MRAFEPTAFENTAFEVGYTGQYLPHIFPFSTFDPDMGLNDAQALNAIQSSNIVANLYRSGLNFGTSGSGIKSGLNSSSMNSGVQ